MKTKFTEHEVLVSEDRNRSRHVSSKYSPILSSSFSHFGFSTPRALSETQRGRMAHRMSIAEATYVGAVALVNEQHHKGGGVNIAGPEAVLPCPICFLARVDVFPHYRRSVSPACSGLRHPRSQMLHELGWGVSAGDPFLC